MLKFASIWSLWHYLNLKGLILVIWKAKSMQDYRVGSLNPLARQLRETLPNLGGQIGQVWH